MSEEGDEPDVIELDARFTCPSCGRRLQIVARYDGGWKLGIGGIGESEGREGTE